MADLPVTPLTHGDGASRADGVGDDDDDGVASASLPSFAPTHASAMPGDLDDFKEPEELIITPQWTGSEECTDGSWAAEGTRGGGEEEAEHLKEGYHAGNFGLLTANWGGNWKEAALQEHMLCDLKSTPCHFLCLQEAEEDMIIHLRTAVEGEGETPAKAKATAEGRPGSKFIGVGGQEPNNSSLMICARQSVVPGIRLLLFHRIIDGAYRVKQRDKKSKGKVAMSRIMIAAAKMRYFKLRGGGEDEDEGTAIDEITICNAHLNHMTAKRDLKEGAKAYKRFWDLLAKYLVSYGPRYLCGDFNMALFSVVPELRARGFQINLAAWYCWQQKHEDHARSDSCAIFRLGPCQGIKMCFDASVFNLNPPALPPNCSMVMEILRNEEGKEIGKRRYPLQQYTFWGQGLPLTSYRPEVRARREQFVNWTFTPVFDKDSPAVAGIMDMATKKDAFPFGVDTSIGSRSWSWPEDLPSKQKLVSFKHFDPQEVFFKRGAHAPLMIFVGAHSDVRRSKDAQRRRAANATRRGWDWERRQTTRPERSKGKGENESKGKGKGKSKGKGKGTQKGAGKQG